MTENGTKAGALRVRTMSAKQYNNLSRLQNLLQIALRKRALVFTSNNSTFEEYNEAEAALDKLRDEFAQALFAQVDALPDDWLIDGAPPLAEIKDISEWIKADRVVELAELVGISEEKRKEEASKN